ncbi:MAG TPA: nuclear transport factor 2 family protein [Mucilaginibacter sp.]|nr:nuclear transport factor 2 family protein [Mucilaginibacter sp.]
MKKKQLLFGLLLFVSTAVFAQRQQAMLYSKDPILAKNKKLVFDFWRTVIEAGHLEMAPQYMAEGYIQHNPNVPTGRQGFLDYFGKVARRGPIVDTIREVLVSITAEGDRVILVFLQRYPDPDDPSKHYFTDSFDMLRIEDGKIAEHWDSALKDK